MHNVVHTGLPLLIMLAMTVVGLELTVADLRRVLHYPMQVVAAVFGQVLLLPLIAAALILTMNPEPAIAGGLILAAAAPQAISSNYFCLLARADIALSVTLTAVSSTLAVATTPLVAALGGGTALVVQRLASTDESMIQMDQPDGPTTTGDGEPAADDTVARPSTSRSGWVMARPLRASSSASVRTSARHRGDRPGGASVRSSSGVVTSWGGSTRNRSRPGCRDDRVAVGVIEIRIPAQRVDIGAQARERGA